MKLTIDNLDGHGAMDYSDTVCADGPLKIDRVLNAPSRCSGMLHVSDAAIAVPARRGRVVVMSDGGAVLFTGYIATEPEALYAGEETKGPIYRYAFSAVSDEWLLDKQISPRSGAGLAQSGGELLRTLTDRTDAALFGTVGVTSTRSMGVFEPSQTSTWSENANDIAGGTYAAYRVLNGAVTLQPAGTVVHALSDGDATLQVAALKLGSVKELANDVTVSGDVEPAAYIAETFAGDGTTAVFQLAEPPFNAKASAARWLTDSFDRGVLDRRVWRVNDPGSHLELSAGGLTMSGGSGFDGQTTLTAIDALELGGTLVIEAGSLHLEAGSAGVVCGLYTGTMERENCFAGYNVRQSGGATVVTPMVNGAEVGTVYTLLDGHRYTLRIRLHCVEMQRVLQTYYAMVDGVVQSFGGGYVSAPMAIVFELQDLGVSSNTPATVLYDGSIVSAPASCSFVAVNSLQLFGAMGYCRVTQAGSAWVVSTLSSGVKGTRLIGIAGEGVDCEISATGKVTFFAGRIPAAGEQVTFSYRSRQRSVARMEDPVSVAAEAASAIPGTARWLGKVVRPAARCSMDCESAALAVLSFSTSRAAALAGTYEALNPPDIWPGDALAVTSGGETVNLLVRRVGIEDGLGWPEALTYRITFANDWAEGLGLKLSESIAVDAWLPETALSAPSNVLANLQQMQVVSATGTALQVDAGTAPPAGGGFEVRRRDWDFGAGVDQDLVLRSPVRSFSIPREGQVERYYVRMYDGSTPPVYSRFSSAVFMNLPVS